MVAHHHRSLVPSWILCYLFCNVYYVAAWTLHTCPVHHQAFPITIHLQYNEFHPIVLHVFLKGVLSHSSSSITLYGFLLYETTNTTLYVEPDHRRIRPRAVYTQMDPHPHMHLTCPGLHTTPVALGPTTDRFWRMTPYMLNITHEAFSSANTDDCMLSVEGMQGVGMPLGPVLRDAVLEGGTDVMALPPSQPVYLTLLAQYFNVPPAWQARALQLHVEWHLRVGFAGTVLYAHTPYLVGLQREPEYKALVDSMHLLTIAFDDTPLVHNYTANDQLIVLNHALLTLRGLNVWVLTIDVDEFWTTRFTTPVQQLQGVSGCLQHAPGDLLTVAFFRHDALLNATAWQLQGTMQHNVPTTKGDLQLLHALHQSRTGGVSSTGAVPHNSLLPYMRYYKVQPYNPKLLPKVWGLNMLNMSYHGRHMVDMLHTMENNTPSQVMFHVADALSVNVHNMLRRDEGPLWHVNTSCALVLHIPNMFGPRVHGVAAEAHVHDDVLHGNLLWAADV